MPGKRRDCGPQSGGRCERDGRHADPRRAPCHPGYDEADAGAELVLDIGLEPAAIRADNPRRAIGHRHYADAADQPADRDAAAKRGERDRKVEYARSDDAADHERQSHPRAEQPRFAIVRHRPSRLGNSAAPA